MGIISSPGLPPVFTNQLATQFDWLPPTSLLKVFFYSEIIWPGQVFFSVKALGSHNFIVWGWTLGHVDICFLEVNNMLPLQKNGQNGPSLPRYPHSNGKGGNLRNQLVLGCFFWVSGEGMPPRYCFTASQGRAAEWTWAFFACFAFVAGEKSVMGWFFSWELMTRWCFQLTYFWNFHPYLPREMIHFEEHIFQMGWFNHQLDEKSVNFHWWLCWDPLGCFVGDFLRHRSHEMQSIIFHHHLRQAYFWNLFLKHRRIANPSSKKAQDQTGNTRVFCS